MAGHVALSTHTHETDVDTTFDFINTLEYENGFPVDHLDRPETAVSWLTEHGLAHPGRIRASKALLAEIRAVRGALREVHDAVVEQRPADAGALERVNQTLRAREVVELVPGGDGLSIGHRHVGDPVDDALSRVAAPLVDLIARGGADRLRTCDNDECRWAFHDTSRTGRRRWCDMASCGNRAKAARHRARAKTSVGTTTGS
jgi:predicted RNA-binding Zn ribbon-like protein